MNEFNLCITLDTDADPVDKNHKNSITFENLDYNLSEIFRNINLIKSKINLEIPISWFVRIDNQIKEIFGEYDWILNNYSKFWDQQILEKNEIHWHAHIYQKIENQWFFPKNDEVFINKIKDVHDYLKKNNLNFNCVRLGEAYMTNNIMNFLRNTGLKADSSCIPGRKRDDNEKSFDWTNSPNHPYFPAEQNYQLENINNKKFIEIPMNTIQTKCSYDKSYFLRYANLAFRNEVMLKGLRNHIQHNDLLVTISHPYEFSNNYYKNSKLFYGDISILENNLICIMNICKEFNKKLKLITINDVIKKFGE